MSVKLGLRIRALRRLKRVTQRELANRVQVSVSMLSSIERGCRLPKLELVEAIARNLGVPKGELLVFIPMEGKVKVKGRV